MTEQDQESYELFRRAIVDRDSDAWSAIHLRFGALLTSWAWRSAGRTFSANECSDIADQALARAWGVLTPERFADFHTLARLLSYLRACVMSTMIDAIRAQTASERTINELQIDIAATPEQIVLADIDSSALWRTAFALASSEAERVALLESFVYGLPPRAILERHRLLFADIAAVYSAKRNLLQRLERNSDIQRLREDFVSI
jgi:DNA-directed RNA polymerase specialized sigma24 family protein